MYSSYRYPKRTWARHGYVLAGKWAGEYLGGEEGGKLGEWAANEIVEDAERSELAQMKRKFESERVDFGTVRGKRKSRRVGQVIAGGKYKIQGKKNPNAKLVNRSAMSVFGKTKTKVTKTIAVPRLLRKQVKQILVGVQAQGSYTTIKEGYVGAIFTGAAVTPFVGDDLGVAQNQVLFGPNTQPPGRTLFNQLVNRLPSPTACSPVANTGLNYFTPAKILDAASVLFNQKTAAGNPYIQTGNLSTVADAGVGTPSTAQIGKLKINVLNSYVTFSIKNVSNRVVTMEIWECMPTQMFQESNPLVTLDSMLKSFNTENLDTSFEYADVNGANVNRALYETSLDPFAIAKRCHGFKFTWKKRVMILAPEETCIHSIRGPKGVFDFAKLQRSTNTAPQPIGLVTQNCLFKGWSVGVVIACSGDQVLSDSGLGGRKLFLGGGNAVLSMPVCVEIKEHYKLAVPEVAGFITQTAPLGRGQPLNLRKHKEVYLSLKEAGNNNYNVSNEVNPIAEGSANNQNQ